MLESLISTLPLVGFAVAGALLASFIALIPALHIYNVAGLALVFVLARPDTVAPEQLALFMLGLIVGYAMLNTIPAIFLSAPDDSLIFAVLPAQKFLLQGRGFEAAVLAGIGSLGGVAVLVALSPFAAAIYPPLRALAQPHLHWILMVIMVYMLMSEWPFSTGRGSAWDRFRAAWSQLLAGMITFALAGILGFVLLYRSPVSIDVAYQNLLPAFVGFFALPAVLQNLIAGRRPPPQHIARTVDAGPELIARGVGAGALGGLFAAFFPLVTGGVGGLLAGHAAAARDDRLFIVSQGASKLLYYVGAFLLFFTPGLHLTRGGMASMISTIYTAYTPDIYFVAVAGLAVSGALSFMLLLWLARGAALLAARVDHRLVAGVTFMILLVVVIGVTGWGGLLIAAVATAIGLIPIFWRTRRMHCLAVLLAPVTLNMAGWGGVVAGWLGLI